MVNTASGTLQGILEEYKIIKNISKIQSYIDNHVLNEGPSLMMMSRGYFVPFLSSLPTFFTSSVTFLLNRVAKDTGFFFYFLPSFHSNFTNCICLLGHH